jgi:hypothetical protein
MGISSPTAYRDAPPSDRLGDERPERASEVVGVLVEAELVVRIGS